jgi:pimeloyl-ACP methyl ester carboxylesterase
MATKWWWACLLGIAVVLAAAGAALRAEIMYVDSDAGNDTNSGGQGQPVRTIARAAQIVNGSSDPGPSTIRLAPGAYCITETVTFENSRAYTKDKRFVIEAAVLPDANDWTPDKMPVVISMMQGRGTDTKKFAAAMKIEVSHAMVRGVKFLGNPRANTWSYFLFRMGRQLDDLVVTQCLFVGDEAVPYNIPIIANGQQLVVDHCVFYKCDIPVIFWDAEGGISRGDAMRYCIVDGADIAAVWVCQTADDFEFHHNVITRSQYVWMRSPRNQTTYTMRDCVITDNQYDSGYGTAERVSGPSGPEAAFKQENVVRNGTVTLIKPEMTPEAPSVRPREYLHVAPRSAGCNLAGLFSHASLPAGKGAATPEYGSNPDKGAYAQINGVRIYYERYGRGAPVLLLHGGYSHIARQGQLIDLLRPHYEVIAVDTRGHGRSTLDDQPLTYPLLADDMAKLVDELGVGRTIGFILAAKHPTKVRALVTDGSHFCKAGRGELTPQANEWIKTITPAMVESWGDMRQPYERLNPEADWDRFVVKVKELWQSDTNLTAEDLKSIRCPVLISHGDRDTFVSLADVMWMREQIAGASLYVAPDGGHSHYREQSGTFGPILLRFLNRVHTTR